MMEIIIGACVSLLTQGFKWLVGKYGYDVTKSAMLLVVFALSIISAMLYEWQFITQEMIETFLRIGAMSIAVYEVVYKRVLEPAIDKIKEKD